MNQDVLLVYVPAWGLYAVRALTEKGRDDLLAAGVDASGFTETLISREAAERIRQRCKAEPADAPDAIAVEYILTWDSERLRCFRAYSATACFLLSRILGVDIVPLVDYAWPSEVSIMAITQAALKWEVAGVHVMEFPRVLPVRVPRESREELRFDLVFRELDDGACAVWAYTDWGARALAEVVGFVPSRGERNTLTSEEADKLFYKDAGLVVLEGVYTAERLEYIAIDYEILTNAKNPIYTIRATSVRGAIYISGLLGREFPLLTPKEVTKQEVEAVGTILHGICGALFQDGGDRKQWHEIS